MFLKHERTCVNRLFPRVGGTCNKANGAAPKQSRAPKVLAPRNRKEHGGVRNKSGALGKCSRNAGGQSAGKRKGGGRGERTRGQHWGGTGVGICGGGLRIRLGELTRSLAPSVSVDEQTLTCLRSANAALGKSVLAGETTFWGAFHPHSDSHLRP